MEDMGMTDKQFDSFIRFLLMSLKDAQRESDEVKKAEKISEVIENLQKSLED